MHALGAVQPCHPNHDDAHDGHVADDPRDLMYWRSEGTGPPVLDVGGDDYTARIPGCPSVADSPLWRR